jgi:hypothetical protein
MRSASRTSAVASGIAAGCSRSTVRQRSQSLLHRRLCSSRVVGFESGDGGIFDLRRAVGNVDHLCAMRGQVRAPA